MLHQNTCLDESCFWYKYYCVELHSLTETILEKLGLVLKSLEVALKRSCCKTKLIHFSSHAFLRLAPPPFYQNWNCFDVIILKKIKVLFFIRPFENNASFLSTQFEEATCNWNFRNFNNSYILHLVSSIYSSSLYCYLFG